MKMNKKLIALIAVIVIAVTAVCLIVFTGKDEPSTTPVEGQPVTVNLEPETTKKSHGKPDYETRITVTLPIECVEAEYRNNLEAYAEAKGYDYVEKKGDDKVKIKMREYSYRLLLTSVGMETVSGIGYAMDSGDYPFVVDLAKYNGDFSDIIFTVDKEKYAEAENKDDFFLTVAFYSLYYQNFDTESKGKCKITVCEDGTNILIESRELSGEDLK